MRFVLSNYGTSFATRGRGQELRETLVSELAEARAVEIDFSNVSNVSYSFADEFIGKLAQESGLRIELVEMADKVESVVQRARSSRLSVCH